MPKVGSKHFGYSKAGVKAAGRYAKKVGKKVSQATHRKIKKKK